MKEFLSNTFLLDNEHSEALYFDHALKMPIIDYHNHLPPKEISENRQFQNLTEIWLLDDHYKWRAMRTCGIDEKYITGGGSAYDKFEKWASTVPKALRNPLYHWTHLELQRYFGITEILNPQTARSIYEQTSSMLKQEDFRVQELLQKMNVEILCTTDDPLDDLVYHKTNSSKIKVLPTFRPDKLLNFQNISRFLKYIEDLSAVTNNEINSFDTLLESIKIRHDYFHKNGCRLSDHGLQFLPFKDFTKTEISSIFKRILAKEQINEQDSEKLQTAILLELCKMNHSRNWAQQFHLGPLRNTNRRLYKKLGADSGFDSIGDFPQAVSMSKFFDELDATDQLAKTVIYNLNPSQNEVFASMIGNYNDGSIKGKMQYGPSWWYLDQLDGMERQMNTLSNIGMLSCFVGMLTDSRSFLSFPRHEYFRRLLCNLLGKEIKQGLLPNDKDLIGSMVEDICYNNAKAYFEFNK